MLIKKIKAQNYKTYLNLDLDISVESEKPIILIGGENGGGKTTLFDAIYGALYGLVIKTAQDFREILNANIKSTDKEKITLELHFSGTVLNEEKDYILSRVYMLNSENKPVESVIFNMSGNIFRYGTATPPKERAESEAQVNKIIKANLPQELSRYFLFDAMESGNLLQKDQLRKVIKENIENVMGFNKFITLSKSAESVYEDQTAQRIERVNFRKEYLDLINQKKDAEKLLEKLNENHDNALEYSIKNKETYENAKKGQNQEVTIKNKIDLLKKEIQSIKDREENYKKEIDLFTKNFEIHICLPQITETLKSEISLILKEQTENENSSKYNFDNQVIDEISENLILFLHDKGIKKDEITISDLKQFLKNLNKGNQSFTYNFFEKIEIQSLNNLVNSAYSNPYPILSQQKNELNIALRNLNKLNLEILDYEKQISGADFDLIKLFEENENKIKKLQYDISEKEQEIKKLEKRIASYDIQNDDEPDPKYETLKKLKPFFEDLANKLLISKKRGIELRMKQDLNNNLSAYKNVIDRVELSENLKDLTFKIFHKSGNEIYLNQLNTASKQVVVQVLLKSLHEFGDYDPPVMIDTVMGVLDEKSRETILENYFPNLSQQTILLSTDTEIRKDKDLKKIEPFISKVYTLVRDKDLQKTEIVSGYFGKEIEN